MGENWKCSSFVGILGGIVTVMWELRGGGIGSVAVVWEFWGGIETVAVVWDL